MQYSALAHCCGFGTICGRSPGRECTMAAEEATFDERGRAQHLLPRWQPAGEPRAVVVICHGVNSHGGQYALGGGAARRERAMRSIALDLRGRGKSEGERFYVEDIADYVARRRRHDRRSPSRAIPACQLFLLGHSAGGVVSGDLCARPSGRDRRLHLRELRLPGAGAGLRAGGDQGAQPHRAAAAACSSSRTRTSRAIRRRSRR